MSAFAILEKLAGIDPRILTPLQRILLITDGTLTEILEAHFLEPVQLVKLAQQIIPADSSHAGFGQKNGDEILERKILLRGANSETVYVYAESAIALGNIEPAFRTELLNSDIPLGRLWREHRLETFKELSDLRIQPAGNLHTHFDCETCTLLLMRSYRVFAQGKAAMLITEWFPAAS